jgi:hypothetical protein
MRFPLLMFLLSFLGLSLSVRTGAFLRGRMKFLDEDERQDISGVTAATLTLLGIIIGFSFSMALARYDQRKNYEEEETNAIGTEYLRVELLPAEYAATAKEQLKKYLEQRIAWYRTRDSARLMEIDRETENTQARLWTAVRDGTAGQSPAVVALTVSGVNDVLNRRGYTQAAWLNRIPPAAWIMMAAVAFFGSMLVGIAAHHSRPLLLVALPLVIAIAFFFIADLDSPRHGLIHVRPQNLLSLSEMLKAH